MGLTEQASPVLSSPSSEPFPPSSLPFPSFPPASAYPYPYPYALLRLRAGSDDGSGVAEVCNRTVAFLKRSSIGYTFLNAVSSSSTLLAPVRTTCYSTSTRTHKYKVALQLPHRSIRGRSVRVTERTQPHEYAPGHISMD